MNEISPLDKVPPAAAAQNNSQVAAHNCFLQTYKKAAQMVADAIAANIDSGNRRAVVEMRDVHKSFSWQSTITDYVSRAMKSIQEELTEKGYKVDINLYTITVSW